MTHIGRRAVFTTFLTLSIAAAALLAAAASGSPRATKAPRNLTLYSLTSEEQFVDNADDRQRGRGNNPFGNFKDTTATTKEKGNGPFPGDEALFKFNVYTDPTLKTNAGTAVYTCLYNFDKNAFCEASYELKGGSLIGGGAFDFNSNTFAIAITGGTGKYRGETGDMQSVPGPNHSERLAFVIKTS